jgi:hypothetical protein
METEYKRLNPAPDKFADFVNHLKATALRPYDFGADRFKAAKAPMFFIHGDADGVRLEHIAEMYRLRGRGGTRRYAAALGVQTGYFARYNTRHADEPQANDRSDDQRLSRCQAPEAVVNGNGNFSDVTQQSDMRGHKFGFSYAADPRVVLTVSGIITERLRGLLGPFVPTPSGSLNRPTFRLQLDTTLRF